MEVKGKVIEKLPLMSGTSAKGEWKKATIVVEIPDGQYTTKLALDNLKDAENFDKIAVGSEGAFQVNVSSHSFNGKWFTSCTCWRWDVTDNITPQVTPLAPEEEQPF